jgi:hypothetical protein
VDRSSSRLEEVENEILDLMVNLGADDEQLEYPTLYASAKEGESTICLRLGCLHTRLTLFSLSQGGPWRICRRRGARCGRC